jgi:hypothetical protein
MSGTRRAGAVAAGVLAITLSAITSMSTVATAESERTIQPLARRMAAHTSTVRSEFKPSPFRTASVPGVPRFFNYQAPDGTADDAGEPSIGVNWKSERTFSNSARSIPNGGTVNYFGGFLPHMVKVTFDDCQSPAAAFWERKTLLTANTTRVYGDPILFTDHVTGRTFVTQEEGLTPAGSTTDITDNDGDMFLPSQGSGAPSCVDHETIGGGPYHTPLPPNPVYPNAIYYASQCVADATIALSLDGGFTFNPSVPMFTIADCDGLHGHVKVAPDGTVYVPDKGCATGNVPLLNGGQPAAIVSEDNGTTWNIRPIPDGSSPGEWDPSVGVASDGTAYLGYQALNGHAMIAVTHDRGLTWSASYDVGAQVGIENIAFPEVVAGDPNRAAFAFYGSTTADSPTESHNGGSNDDPNAFSGVWHLYIATTFDGGQTWTTQNVTPGDPIQRGPICGGSTCRNLLDFFDATIDKEGRVLVGWDDGCISGCVNSLPNSFTARGTITRQCGGKRMFAAFDPIEPALPEAPGVAGNVNGAGTAVDLSWAIPDDAGATITAYKVYRSVGLSGPFTLIATVNENRYTDGTFTPPATGNYYRVTAVNAQGEGPYCQAVAPAAGPGPTACDVPGIHVLNDTNPDGSDNDPAQQTPPDARVNVRHLYVAEPPIGAGEMLFTMQLAASTMATPPPSSQWYLVWQRIAPDADFDRWFVAMKSDANSALTFEYGKFGVPLDPSNPNPNANTPVTIGTADNGSYDPSSGLVTIQLSTSKAENIQPGQSLTDLNVRTFLAKPDGGPRSQNIASDITSNATYILVGNCHVNQPPVASLAANPTLGNAPLLVHFDGSGSFDPDAGDAVASYTFNFGDGTQPVTQSTPTIDHTYTSASSPAGFFATLTVKDMNGKQSANIASINIQITSNPATCILPGLVVLTDPKSTDDTPPVADPQQDIESISVAEPWGIGDKLVFTMKVTSLNPGSLPPNSFWRIIWQGPGTGTANQHYVDIVNCASGGLSSHYGHFTTGSVPDGVTDAYSMSPDGTIQITIAKSKVGNPTAGTLLTSLNGDTRDIVGDCPPSIAAAFPPIDVTGNGQYLVVGNDYCKPLSMVCAGDFTGSPGHYTLNVQVTNPSTANRVVHVIASDANGWLDGGSFSTDVGPIASNQSSVVPVQLTVPANCDPAQPDAIQFHASSLDLPASGASSCETTVACGLVSVGQTPHQLSFAVVGSNPFSSKTSIGYALPRKMSVRIDVFSLDGRRVRTLVSGEKEAGAYVVALRAHDTAGSDLTPGVYFVNLTAGSEKRNLRVIAVE